MKIYSGSNVGQIRKNNEDYVYISHQRKIYIVADGMGGHNAGEVASQKTVEFFLEYLDRFEEIKTDILADALSYANQNVFQLSQTNSEYKGMGTTFTAAHFNGNMSTIIHVGDSRAYKFSQNESHQITEDHTLVHALYKKGKLTESEYINHPNSHVLVKAVGTSEYIIPDIYNEFFKDDDYLILSSDGLTDHVTMEELSEYIRTYREPNKIVDALIRFANEKGGSDNISIICIKFENEKEL